LSLLICLPAEARAGRCAPPSRGRGWFVA
jgi:hypothetical protein